MRSDIAEGGGAADLDEPEGERCAYVIDAADDGRPARFCGAPCRPGSAYCPEHHALCRLRGGSAAERRRLREIEALAAAAGGKQVLAARNPSALMLRRLERAARSVYARRNRSCYVQKRDRDAPHRSHGHRGGGTHP